MTRNNILYLPIFKLNNNIRNKTSNRSAGVGNQNDYIVLADLNTQKDPNNEGAEIPELKTGILRGHVGTTTPANDFTNHIAVDQGIDSQDGGISISTEMPHDLVETAFIMRADHRLLRLHNISSDQSSTEPLTNQFIDDDGIAHYYVALGDGSGTVEGAPSQGGPVGAFQDARRQYRDVLFTDPDLPNDTHEAFQGPLGSILRIYPRSSLHVEQSGVLFDEIGSSATNLAIANDVTLASYKFIDTLINIVGVTTGYSIDIPIRIVKKT